MTTFNETLELYKTGKGKQIPLPSTVLFDSTLSAAAFKCYAWLTYYGMESLVAEEVDEHGNPIIRPGMADLAAKLGKDVSSLRRILAELEAHSLCKRTGQPKAMWEKRAIVVYLPKA